VITGSEVTKTYTGVPVLEKIDFKIGNGRKIGIVGKNGCGKTTLFNLIAGKLEMDGGNIQIQQETIAYLPQEFNFPNELVGEYLEKKLEHTWETYKIEALVAQLRFENYNPYQEIETLSEGQKMKLKMIELLLEDPTAFLVDEPTNHLDIEGIAWFENYIKHLDMSVIMISHDREFLNNCVDEIWEIENASLIRFVGNYDHYKKEKLKLINKWDQDYKLFLKRKSALEKLLENARKIKDGKSRGRAVESAKKRIKRELEDNSKEKYSEKVISDVEFDTNITHSKLMVSFENVSKKYESNTVFEKLSFDIRGGEKVWLFGPNGSGKTTIVKLITEIEKPTNGSVKMGSNIRVGYFAQRQTHLNYDKSLHKQFIEKTRCPYEKSFGHLKKFLFDKDMLAQRVDDLSPGQRARFAFAIFAYNDYDLLILDEPTNHLDIETKEVVEKSLANYKGTLLLVSHDRYFVGNLGITKVLNLKEGKLLLC